MEIVLVYLSTVIMSFIFELDNGFTMFKDVADAGYKIDIDRMTEFTNKIKNSKNTNSLLRILIPFYNVFIAMQLRMQYNQQKFAMLDQLNVMDCIEEMTEAEKIEYAKKPTGLNAIMIPLKSSIQASKAIKIEIKDEGTLWYIFDDKTKEIKIVKAEGPIAKLSLEEQKAKIDEVNGELAKKLVESFASVEELKKEMTEAGKSENVLNLNNYPKTTSEKITDLKELRNELTQSETTVREEKGYQKTNKKDK